MAKVHPKECKLYPTKNNPETIGSEWGPHCWHPLTYNGLSTNNDEKCCQCGGLKSQTHGELL